MGDEYAGPVTVVAGDVTARADARLTGHVEPVDGRFHWGGRLAPSAELAGLVRAGARAVVLRVDGGPPCDAWLQEVDPWGGVRVSALGSPPWTVEEPGVTEEAAARSSTCAGTALPQSTRTRTRNAGTRARWTAG